MSNLKQLFIVFSVAFLCACGGGSETISSNALPSGIHQTIVKDGPPPDVEVLAGTSETLTGQFDQLGMTGLRWDVTPDRNDQLLLRTILNDDCASSSTFNEKTVCQLKVVAPKSVNERLYFTATLSGQTTSGALLTRQYKMRVSPHPLPIPTVLVDASPLESFGKSNDSTQVFLRGRLHDSMNVSLSNADKYHTQWSYKFYENDTLGQRLLFQQSNLNNKTLNDSLTVNPVGALQRIVVATLSVGFEPITSFNPGVAQQSVYITIWP